MSPRYPSSGGSRSRGRKPYAWQRGRVRSSIPASERKAKCLACSAEVKASALRFGYCRTCWTPPP